MEFKQFHYFLQAAKMGHITNAAASLYITQPALTKVIARLEAELDCTLFEKDGRKLKLSEEGEIVARYAQNLEDFIEEMNRELKYLKNGFHGLVRIGTSFPNREPNTFLSLLSEYMLEHPDICTQIHQYTPENLEKALLGREIDIAMTTRPIVSPSVIFRKVSEEHMGVILSVDSPLAQKPVLCMKDLSQEHFFCNNASSDSLCLTREFCHLAGFDPIIAFDGDFPSYIGKAVGEGLGVSIISEDGYHINAANPERAPWEEKITYRNLADPFCYRICGITYMDGIRNAAAVNFLSYLNSQLQIWDDPDGNEA